jgi:hypothetical protein
MMRRWSALALMAGTAALAAPVPVPRGGPLQRAAGLIESVEGDRVQVRTEQGVLEVGREELTRLLGVAPRAGERVMLRFRVKLESAKRGEGGEQPGTLAPPAPAPSQEILDDRAFFNARGAAPAKRAIREG